MSRWHTSGAAHGGHQGAQRDQPADRARLARRSSRTSRLSPPSNRMTAMAKPMSGWRAAQARGPEPRRRIRGRAARPPRARGRSPVAAGAGRSSARRLRRQGQRERERRVRQGLAVHHRILARFQPHRASFEPLVPSAQQVRKSKALLIAQELPCGTWEGEHGAVATVFRAALRAGGSNRARAGTRLPRASGRTRGGARGPRSANPQLQAGVGGRDERADLDGAVRRARDLYAYHLPVPLANGP